METEKIVEKINKHYQELLGFYPRRTWLSSMNAAQWKEYCNRSRLNSESEGIFTPRNMTAYVLESSGNKELSIFHEYFGHALFFEYSKKGKILDKLERRLQKDETKEFKGKSFSFEELQEFRKADVNFTALQKEKEKNIGLYETFAIWTENYLSEKLGINDKFEAKYRNADGIKKNLNEFLEFQEKYGELALFYEIGMPKYYNKDKIKGLISNLFKEDAESAKIILLYGSKRPYSDIDLFTVSDPIKRSSNDWLDVYSVSKEEFEYKLRNFDVSVTDPILTGEFIAGDRQYLESKKLQLMNQPITESAIYYNLMKSREQRVLGSMYLTSSKESSVGGSYGKTYFKNAFFLKQGIRKLTKKEIIGN
jgi:hypothetical protein